MPKRYDMRLPALAVRQGSRRLYSFAVDGKKLPLLATVFHGGHAVLMPKFGAETYLRVAEALRATHTMLVPVQYQRVLAHPRFDDSDLSAFVLKQCTRSLWAMSELQK